MPRRPQDQGTLPPHLQALINSMTVDELRAAVPQLLSLASDRAMAMATAEAPAPSRLRPPRDDVVTYRVRVDLQGAKPPIWRRVHLASDMTLDVLHRVLQVVMGWTDSHLHGFSSGGDLYDRNAERYPTEFDLSEGEEGTPETEVRLDQVLQDVGDRLHYEYDFGDGWSHRIVLEAVKPHEDGAPAAECLAGRRACPPEDVGGVHSYNELLEVLDAPDDTDPMHENLAEQIAWLGPDFDPASFSVEEVNERLRYALVGVGADSWLPERLTAMLARTGPDGRPLLEELVARSCLDDDTSVSADVAGRMVAPYAWLIRQVGVDGVQLTSAGYLPPVLVEAVVAELDLDREWIGKLNRESHTYPVLEFREGAQALGLLKKRSGRLTVTAPGRRVADDPVALWQHIAERLPLGRTDAEREAGTVALLLAAAEEGLGWPVREAIATVLRSLGWREGDQPLSPSRAFGLARPTWDVLHRMGAVTEHYPRGAGDFATPEGRLLARAALRAG